MLLLIAALLSTDTTTQTLKVAVGRDESLRVVTSGAGEPALSVNSSSEPSHGSA